MNGVIDVRIVGIQPAIIIDPRYLAENAVASVNRPRAARRLVAKSHGACTLEAVILPVSRLGQIQSIPNVSGAPTHVIVRMAAHEAVGSIDRHALAASGRTPGQCARHCFGAVSPVGAAHQVSSVGKRVVRVIPNLDVILIADQAVAQLDGAALARFGRAAERDRSRSGMRAVDPVRTGYDHCPTGKLHAARHPDQVVGFRAGQAVGQGHGSGAAGRWAKGRRAFLGVRPDRVPMRAEDDIFAVRAGQNTVAPHAYRRRLNSTRKHPGYPPPGCWMTRPAGRCRLPHCYSR